MLAGVGKYHHRTTTESEMPAGYCSSIAMFHCYGIPSHELFIDFKRNLILIVREPDHFSVPKGGTNSSLVFCKDHTLECSKLLTGPLYIVAYKRLGMMIQSMEMSTQVHNVLKY